MLHFKIKNFITNFNFFFFRKEIIIRIDTIKKQPEPTSTDFPPSYEEAVTEAGLMAKPDGKSNNGNNFHLPGTHKTEVPYISPSMVHDPLLLANLQIKEAENHNAQNSGLSQQMNDMMIGKREEILFHCNNVLLHFIAPDGRVSSTSETNTLVIARLYGE